MNKVHKSSNSEGKSLLVTLLSVITGEVTVACKYDTESGPYHYYMALNSFK
jgi:hypothetical protein